MAVAIDHLLRHAHLTEEVARLIHAEFWADRPGGMTEADLVAHLGRATDPSRIPLSLIALDGADLVGTVNLIDNDDARRAHLHPWLAAMVVKAAYRGQGIGTRLVLALLGEATRLGHPRVYFGTDGPGFYARLGAELHEQVTPAFCIMRFPLPVPGSRG